MFEAFIFETVRRLAQWWLLCSAFLAFELIVSAEARKLSLASRMRGATFKTLFLAATGLAIATVGRIHPAPIIDAHLPVWLATATAFVLGDVAYYWWHRLQHSVPLLWRLHAVHHGIREMSALNLSEHWSENFLRMAFISLPVGMLAPGGDPRFFAAFAWCAVTLELMNHCAVPLSFGRLRWLVVDQPVHRLHHALDAQHWGCNFGGFLACWDMIFGTWRAPEAAVRPEIGLADRGEIDSLMGWFAADHPMITRAP